MDCQVVNRVFATYAPDIILEKADMDIKNFRQLADLSAGIYVPLNWTRALHYRQMYDK